MACNTGMDNANQFLVSVADVKIFDCDNGVERLMINGKTKLNTSLTQTIQTTSLYAGKGAQKIFEYNYQKELAIALEDAAFDVKYIAMQNGTTIVNQLSEFYKEEEVTFDPTGVATLTGTPSGVVQVQMSNGEFMAVPAVDQTITDIAFADVTATVVYAEMKNLDTITIDAKSFPKAMKLVMNVDIFTNAGKIQEMQIVIPQFKPDGALDLSLTTDGVASSTLNGTALIDQKGNYAYFAFENVAGATGANAIITGLATNPSLISLDATGTETVAVKVLGLRGGIYGNVPLVNTDLTFTSKDTAVAQVSANGVISLGDTATVGNETTIEVSNGTYKDVIVVEII